MCQLVHCLNIVIIWAWLRSSCCNGFLHTYRTEKGTFGPSSRFGYDRFPLHVSLIQKAGGISYRQSVCTVDELKSMQKEISIVMKQLSKERSSIAQNRLGATLPRDQTSTTLHILENGSIFELVERLANSYSKNAKKRKIILAQEIPVEVRLYEQVGASMAWHRDDILYDPPQLEVVFTLENNSDCVTMWKLESENANDDFKIKPDEKVKSQETHPNSLLLLAAGGPNHCVTSLKRGRRVILKCAYVYEGARYIGEQDHYQFGKPNSKKMSKNKRRKGKIKR